MRRNASTVRWRPTLSTDARAACSGQRAARHAVQMSSSARAAALRTVTTRDGLARLRDLRDAGHSRRTIDGLRADGALITAGRGWVALPGADPYLVAAARAGIVLTCVTAAARCGLWIPEGIATPHVGARAHSSRAAGLPARVHWTAPLVPRHPSSLVDPIENVLQIVATCQPYEHALAVWESALHQKLTDIDLLRGFTWGPAARRLLADAQPWSDAGLETYVVPRLRWLHLPLRRQIWLYGHRVDLLIGDRLVLQIDGGTHVGRQRESDIAHDAELRLRGYTVFRVGYRQVIHEWPAVQDLLMRAVAQGLYHAR